MTLWQCPTCKHYAGVLKCFAYPNGIPKVILEGGDHTKPRRGDNGIQFEPATAKTGST
jgi:hypothetical protein